MSTRMSGWARRLMLVIAVLAVCGIVVSSVSLRHHYATSKTEFCDIGETFNCDIVNRSEYSTLLGIPVALIGMMGYAALAGLATVYRDRRETPAMLFGGAAVGLAFALYLTYVEAHVLGVYCILCLSSLSLIAMTTILAALIWWKGSNQ
ncbi:MAG: vitamin K epoxide reductase family protein [Terriglobales bacterium]